MVIVLSGSLRTTTDISFPRFVNQSYIKEIRMAGEMTLDDYKAKYEYYRLKCQHLKEDLAAMKEE